jgi:hypothetical protein
VVVAHRELADVTDDTAALGPAPKPGQVEAYAAWRAAWRALGRPDVDRAEAEMSTPQLRVRVRAYQREQAWAPPSVAEELAGTRQQAEDQRRTATLRATEADACSDAETAARLRGEAGEAKALAQALDARASELAIVDQARAEWYAHTAATREAALRATDELKERGVDNSDEGTTTEEWLAAHRASDQADDQHRLVTDEHELADVAQQRDTDTIAAVPGAGFMQADLVNDQLPSKSAEPAVDEIPGAKVVADDNTSADDATTAGSVAAADRAAQEGQVPVDIREVAAGEERVAESDAPRVPSADESAEAVRRAQRALIEIQHRREAEERHAAAEAEERDEELARWHADDSSADRGAATRTQPADAAAKDSGPVMELGSDED